MTMTMMTSVKVQENATHKIVSLWVISFLLPYLLQTCDACSSRAIIKPRPTTLPSSGEEDGSAGNSDLPRPNITFPIFNCPSPYASWYCLNDATCFVVEIHNEILYNCECANGFMGPRCEYKEIDGSYLPTRQRVMLEKASIASGATLALLLVFIVCLMLYIRHEKKIKQLEQLSTQVDGHENEGMDVVDGMTRVVPELRPFGPHHYKKLPRGLCFS